MCSIGRRQSEKNTLNKEAQHLTHSDSKQCIYTYIYIYTNIYHVS